MILSNLDTKGNSIDTVIVDQLKGDPFEVPLLKKWKLTGYINTTNMSNCFIGDISKDDYSYLLPVMNNETQMAVIKTKGTDFSLLPTLCPIPMESQWGPIYYNTQFLIDHKARRAYIIGSGPNIEKKQEKGYRLYVLGIDYDHLENGKAPLILYYSDVMTEVPSGPSTITEEGNIVLAGGIPKGSNFTPTAAVYLLHTGTKPTATSYRNFSLWIGSAVVVLLLCIVGLVMKRQKKIVHIDTESPLPYTEANKKELTVYKTDEKLMSAICNVMEEQLYLNESLKLSDISALLSVSRNTVSTCINNSRNCSFSQFVASYRVEYAKQLIEHKPDLKLSHVWTQSGFSNETSFFRTFKSIIGMTPSEWKKKVSEEASK
ncbi:MAG: helix-turn-helix domain-containing protein [Phocaeicola sp.]|uniref:helix-turn-helix domain-containing protein n=1 Tax=Phocaeicola sp. TaxID=2773926 RepID=UPI003F9F30AA